MNTNKEFSSYEVTPEEQERLDKLSSEYCYECGTRLTVGEAECGDICTKCYIDEGLSYEQI